ncbi:MAG: SDR family NAD(P)-dependent oxidoreductase, partial [Gemmatimonadetes bacterium]|nr:SDR family NAD(P)-dependent oxidoreductase [Gemmatimonadota bacterium]
MNDAFSLQDRVAVVTGGCGVLGGRIAEGLAAAGAHVALLDRRAEAAAAKAAEIQAAGGSAEPFTADVLDRASLHQARRAIETRWGRADILVNAAGGNVARARSDERDVFEVPLDAHEEVLRLNLHGTVLPSLEFAEGMAARGHGSIVNISSMAAQQAMSGVLGYSMAKAAVESFTRWLAVDMARRHGSGIRVNAIAPGFFITTQNRDVLIAPDGSYTERSRTILARTPMGRFGQPEELVGAVQWLCSAAASI